ncbi:MAG: site-specific integrase [Planctomycetes bacterium]|nr:site-specific integrase [Planctomycetota bacterium]
MTTRRAQRTCDRRRVRNAYAANSLPLAEATHELLICIERIETSVVRLAALLRIVRGPDRGDPARTIELVERPRRSKRRRRFGYVFSRRWASGRKTWSAQWFDQSQGGKRVTRHFDAESDANEFLDELERQILAKVYVTPPTAAETMHMEPVAVAPVVPTLVSYAADLVKLRLAASLAVNTLNLYSSNLLALSAFYGERRGRPALRLDEITVKSFLDYRAVRRTLRNSPDGRGGSVSAATVNRDQQFLCRVLNEAVVDGHLAANPLIGLKKLKEPRKPRRYLTKAEIALVLEHAPPRFRPLVLAALYTGARKCELTRLRWSDLDFENGKIALFRQKVGNADMLDLHPTLGAELKRLRAKRKDAEDTDFIFLSRRGVAFTNISRSWELAIAGAGLTGRGLTFHGLRHAFATFYLSGGGAVTDLQMQLGHADLSTTQRYAACLSERRRATVMAMSFGATKRSATAGSVA